MSNSVPVQMGGVAVMGTAAIKAGSEAVRGLPVTGAQAVVEASNYVREIAMVASGVSLTALSFIRGKKHVEMTAGESLD